MSISNIGTGGQLPEPFRTFANKYLEVGFSVFPCGGDGKKPLVKWKALQSKKASQRTIDNWCDKFPSANIAIVTGELSNLTVVDCDNPNITLTNLLNDFGNTQMIAQTPRGGYHLYYAFNGESNSCDSVGKIDIRGQGGFVIAPPSYSSVYDASYTFYTGDLWQVQNLPFMLHSALKQRGYSEGERNKSLFSHLKNQAHLCNSYDSLLGCAIDFNINKLSPPLEHNEVERTVNSIWNYKEKGQLFVGGGQRLIVDMDKVNNIKFIYPPAVSLYLDLLSCHRGVNRVFAICPKSYNKRCGWSATTIRKARDALVDYELIRCVYIGGKRNKDPSLYQFC